MTLAVDLTGSRFGRLTVLAYFDTVGNCLRRWVCRCDCGEPSVVYGANLTRGHTTSCGCAHSEVIVARNRTHGLRRHPLYNTWHLMIQRCRNPKNAAYHRYGGRGIAVCERWMKFENFLADMGEKPALAMSLERKDNDGDYKPENCKWATALEQSRNRRCNIYVTYHGARMLYEDFLKQHGAVGQPTASRRIRNGWNRIDAVVTPP